MPGLYRYEAIREVHLEPTSKCNLACPMCARNVFGGPVSPNLSPSELSARDFEAIFEPALLARLETLLLCGNYGDPILARDVLEIIRAARAHNPKLKVILHSHGSARRPDWWAELGALKARVVFGIDGLEDTLGRYRRGADFAKVIDNARAFVAAGGRARWRFLVFEHNQHQVEAARALAAELGFERFDVKHTHRFYRASFVPRGPDGRPDPSRPPRYPVHDREGREVGALSPPTRTDLDNPGFARALAETNGSGFRKLREAREIVCKARDPASVYVSADRLAFPCCWTANVRAHTVGPDHPVLALAARTVGGLAGLRVPDTPLAEVVEGPFFAAVADSWARPSVEAGRLRTCADVCGGGRPVRAEARLSVLQRDQ